MFHPSHVDVSPLPEKLFLVHQYGNTNTVKTPAAAAESGRAFVEERTLKIQRLKTFYPDAIKSFRYGKTVEKCPLCLDDWQENKDDNAHPSSHIFPRALLDAYKEIHCPTDDSVFIYYGGFKSSNCVSHRLFCHTCEANASDEEQLLRKIYLQIMATDDDFVTIDVDEAEKLKHILATIMFRGLLFTSEDMGVVRDTMIELQEYCVKKDVKKYEKDEISKRIIIYFLPNKCCFPKNPLPTHILDLQLRRPLLTTIEETSGFFYTKFDCFHCLLPILPVQDEAIYDSVKGFDCLRCDQGSYSLLCNTKLPDILLNYNISQVENLVKRYTELDKICHCVIEKTFSGSTSRTNPKKNNGMAEKLSDLQERASKESPIKSCGQNARIEESKELLALQEKNARIEKLKALQERASKESPIKNCGQNARIEELEKEKKALTEKLDVKVPRIEAKLEKVRKSLDTQKHALSSKMKTIQQQFESWTSTERQRMVEEIESLKLQLADREIEPQPIQVQL